MLNKISVIIPVYNVEKYLKKCLDSVINQSFDALEIICVEDSSTDASAMILQEYAKKDKRIHIFHHEVNKGLSAARNTGMKLASGKYIFFLDSDDWLRVDALSALYACAEKNKTDIVYFNMRKVQDEEESGVINTKPIAQYQEYQGIYTGQELFTLFMENSSFKMEAWRQFFRREFLIENNLWFYEKILHEDTLFSFLCAMKANRVMNINEEYYFYRQRANSITSLKNKLRADSSFVVVMEIFQYWNNHIFPEHVNQAIKKYFISRYQMFKKYKDWDVMDVDADISVGSMAEKVLYSLLYQKYQYVTLSAESIGRIKEFSKVIIYGAGKAAEEVVHILHANNISIYGIAVSSMAENPTKFCGINVDEIVNYCDIKEEAVIVVGITKKHRVGIVEGLKNQGYVNIIEVQDIR